MVFVQRHHSRCACAGAPFALSGTTRKYERSRPFSTLHLALDLTLDFKKRTVTGSAKLSFERQSPLDHVLSLDAIGFELAKVSLSTAGRTEPAKYSYDGERIEIQIPADLDAGEVEVEYRAKPRRGLYFLAPDDKVKSRPLQVWSQCQDEDARHWFPCQDKPHVKMTTEMRVSVPHGLVALSNGELIEQKTPKSARANWQYHYRLDQPHPSYLVTLVVGSFAILEDKVPNLGAGASSPRLRYYVPRGREADGWRAFGDTPRMLELFSRLTGVAYPWSSYSQVVVSDFVFGGMENTTATTMYEHILLDERAKLDISSNDLVAHELAHQWFGDYVTCRDWSHAWLNEGFATFFEHLEREDRLGGDEYDYGIAADVDSYLGEASGRYQRAIVCRDYQEPIDLFDRHLYEKGGLVLHQLRRQLGDTVFWRGVNDYLTRHRGGIVETNDLQRALERASGRSLEEFFDHWLYRPGHPVLKVKVSYENRLLMVHVKQVQKLDETSVFRLPLKVRVGLVEGAASDHERVIETASDALVIPSETRPAWVEIDPEFQLIGSLTISAPGDMLRTGLRRGGNARARWLAARALADKDDVLSIDALGACLKDEGEAWMVRVEAARALGRIRGEDAFRYLALHVKTEHPKVRRAVVSQLGRFQSSAAFGLLAERCKSDPSYLVKAAAAEALGATRQAGALALLTPLLDEESWAEVVRSGAVRGLGRTRDEEALSSVLKMTEYGVPTRARRAAVQELPVLSEGPKVREHLERLLDDTFPHVRISVISALEELGDRKVAGILRRHLAHELDGRVARRCREALRSLGESGKARHDKLSEELEALRGEVSELKLKLTKLESAQTGNGNGLEVRSSPHKAKPRAPAKKPARRRPAARARAKDRRHK